MVNTFTIKHQVFDSDFLPARDLFKQIRDRCKECTKPSCWELKDPRDKGSIYLSRKFFSDKKGRQVQIRQALFQITYEEPAPIGRTIHMACENSRCVNPAHYCIAGWTPPWNKLEPLIGVYITKKDAIEFHGRGE